MQCPAGQSLEGQLPPQVSAMARERRARYTDWSQACCECIAKHESGGNAHAENYNSNGSYDIGLYQVNNINWAQCSAGKAPCDPVVNVECAHKVWEWGAKTWKLWSTCGACGCCGKA